MSKSLLMGIVVSAIMIAKVGVFLVKIMDKAEDTTLSPLECHMSINGCLANMGL